LPFKLLIFKKENMKIIITLGIIASAWMVQAQSYMPLMVSTNGSVAAPLEFWGASPVVLSYNGKATNLTVVNLSAKNLQVNNGAVSGYLASCADASGTISWIPNTGASSAIVGLTNFQQRLIEWSASEAYQATNAVYDSDGCLVSANIVWPDGSAGVFARTSKDALWLTVNGYWLSHVNSGLFINHKQTRLRNSNFNLT
jgi:hypothetical protein